MVLTEQQKENLRKIRAMRQGTDINQEINSSIGISDIPEEDIIAERPADLGGSGITPAVLPDPLGTIQEPVVDDFTPPVPVGRGAESTGDVVRPTAEGIGLTGDDFVEPVQPVQQPVEQQMTPSIPETVTEPIVAPTASTEVPVVGSAVEPGLGLTSTGDSKSLTELQKELGQAFEAEQTAVEKIGQIQAEAEEQRTKVIAERQSVLDNFAEKQKSIIERAESEYKSELEAINSQIQELNDKEYKGFWQSKSTAEKITGAIAIALGAFAQGLSGGKLPNTALNIINKAMDDDYNQYKESVDKKLKLIQQSRASSQAKQRATDMELRRLDAYRVGQLNQFENKLNELASKSNSTLVQEKANQLIAQLGQRRIREEASIRAKIEDNVRKNAERATAKLAANLKEQKKEAKELKEKLVPGVGVVLTRDDAKKMKDARDAKEKATFLLNRLIDLRSQYGGEILNREAVGEAAQKSTDLLLQLKELNNLGVLSQSDTDLLNKLVPEDPLQFDAPGFDTTMNQLKNLKDSLEFSYKQGIESRLDADYQVIGDKLYRKEGKGFLADDGEFLTPDEVKFQQRLVEEQGKLPRIEQRLKEETETGPITSAMAGFADMTDIGGFTSGLAADLQAVGKRIFGDSEDIAIAREEAGQEVNQAMTKAATDNPTAFRTGQAAGLVTGGLGSGGRKAIQKIANYAGKSGNLKLLKDIGSKTKVDKLVSSINQSGLDDSVKTGSFKTFLNNKPLVKKAVDKYNNLPEWQKFIFAGVLEEGVVERFVDIPGGSLLVSFLMSKGFKSVKNKVGEEFKQEAMKKATFRNWNQYDKTNFNKKIDEAKDFEDMEKAWNTYFKE